MKPRQLPSLLCTLCLSLLVLAAYTPALSAGSPDALDPGRTSRARPTGIRSGSIDWTTTLATGPACAPETFRVSVDSGGSQGLGDSFYPTHVGLGALVAFASEADNLAPGNAPGYDVFIHDPTTGVTALESVNTLGDPGNANSGGELDFDFGIVLSQTGRYLGFGSLATNFAYEDPTACTWVGVYICPDGFLRDRRFGTTEKFTYAQGGNTADHESYVDSVSSDGQYVAFTSYANDLVRGYVNGALDVFVWDGHSGQITLESISTAGGVGLGHSMSGSLSGDGRYLAFTSAASNLIPGDINGMEDVFLMDRDLDVLIRISEDQWGTGGNGQSGSPVVSRDGRYIAFVSNASNLVPSDLNGKRDVFVYERTSGDLTRESLQTGLGEANGDSGSLYWLKPAGISISSDGRYVAFQSEASDLVPGDTNGVSDIFIRDRRTQVTERVSVTSQGSQVYGASEAPSLRDDGCSVAFSSVATSLVAGDTNGDSDIFVHTRCGCGFQRLFLPLLTRNP